MFGRSYHRSLIETARTDSVIDAMVDPEAASARPLRVKPGDEVIR